MDTNYRNPEMSFPPVSQEPWAEPIDYHPSHQSPTHEYTGFQFNGSSSHLEHRFPPGMHRSPLAHSPATGPGQLASFSQVQGIAGPPWPSLLANPGAFHPQGHHQLAHPMVPMPQNATLMMPNVPPQYQQQPQPPLPPAAAGSHPRKTLTDADRKNMCIYAAENPSKKQTEIGERFGVERSTVSKVLRQKDKYLSQDDSSRSPIRKPKGKTPDLERTLAVWAKKQEKQKNEVTNEKIKEQGRVFWLAMEGRDDEQMANLNSPAWMEKFKHKHNLQCAKRSSLSPSHEKQSPSPESSSAIEEDNKDISGLGITSTKMEETSPIQSSISSAPNREDSAASESIAQSASPFSGSQQAFSDSSAHQATGSAGTPLYTPDPSNVDGSGQQYFSSAATRMPPTPMMAYGSPSAASSAPGAHMPTGFTSSAPTMHAVHSMSPFSASPHVQMAMPASSAMMTPPSQHPHSMTNYTPSPMNTINSPTTSTMSPSSATATTVSPVTPSSITLHAQRTPASTPQAQLSNTASVPLVNGHAHLTNGMNGRHQVTLRPSYAEARHAMDVVFLYFANNNQIAAELRSNGNGMADPSLVRLNSTEEHAIESIIEKLAMYGHQ